MNQAALIITSVCGVERETIGLSSTRRLKKSERALQDGIIIRVFSTMGVFL